MYMSVGILCIWLFVCVVISESDDEPGHRLRHCSTHYLLCVVQGQQRSSRYGNNIELYSHKK